jgi:hypothetical protein
VLARFLAGVTCRQGPSDLVDTSLMLSPPHQRRYIPRLLNICVEIGNELVLFPATYVVFCSVGACSSGSSMYLSFNRVADIFPRKRLKLMRRQSSRQALGPWGITPTGSSKKIRQLA